MKIGIVCDNYKLDKFKEELKAYIGLAKPYGKDTTLIKIYCEQHQMEEIKKICEKVEEFFRIKKSNLN